MSTELGDALLACAREAIASRLSIAVAAAPAHDALDQPGACFVTLTLKGRLRGCIGSLEARRSVREDVHANAQAAAFRDPRFAPLTAAEWPHLALEVSVLGPAQYRLCPSEASAVAWLRPGTDGVILAHGAHHATFLPQVWSQLPDPHEFLHELRRKAGLPTQIWLTDMQVGRYAVEKFGPVPAVQTPFEAAL